MQRINSAQGLEDRITKNVLLLVVRIHNSLYASSTLPRRRIRRCGRRLGLLVTLFATFETLKFYCNTIYMLTTYHVGYSIAVRTT